MEFIQKAEYFFLQLQFGLSIAPEPIVTIETDTETYLTFKKKIFTSLGFSNNELYELQEEERKRIEQDAKPPTIIQALMLPPSVFFELTDKWGIEYPFIPENKIIELKLLMKKEGIETADALSVVANLKSKYWDTKSVILFQEVVDRLYRLWKSVIPDISENKLFFEQIKFLEYLEAKREKYYSDLVSEIQGTPTEAIKKIPEQNRKQIIFKDNETIERLYSELQGYFDNKDGLLKALQGEKLSEMLLFPHNQNKLVEVFRRLKYNGYLLSNNTEIMNWICDTFAFTKKGHTDPQQFKKDTVWALLSKGKGEPPRKEQICVADWLPYKSPFRLAREKENEKL